MDNCPFSRKALKPKGNRVDRFIFHREYLDKKRQYWRSDTLTDCNDFLDIKQWSRRKYISHINKAFGMEKNHDDYLLKWPCKPRKKSFLTPADTVLDLPSFSATHYPELLDCSHNGNLVAALGSNYYKWNWDKQSIVGNGHTIHNIQSCKFNSDGRSLALGLEFNRIEIHDSETNTYVLHQDCTCRNLDYFCSITTIDWSPKNNGLIVGCSRSVVTSFDKYMKVVNSLEWTKAQMRRPISSVRISPDARFAAIAITQSTNVYVVEWPSLQSYQVFEFQDSFTTAISWHPWRSTLLVRGGDSFANETCIAMCSVLNESLEETVLPGQYALDGMLFSSKTGELAMSLYDIERGKRYPNTSSRLVVLSDMSTIVDQWSDYERNGLNHVKTMIFSPDGTKLATATLDEDLVIWNFLPKTKEETKVNKLLSSGILR